jgi:hypothetical protein
MKYLQMIQILIFRLISTCCPYLLEDLRIAATLTSGTPASDSAHGASIVLLMVSREANGGNVFIEGNRLSQLQQADIILNSPGIILLMHLHSLDSNINLRCKYSAVSGQAINYIIHLKMYIFPTDDSSTLA